MSRGKYRRSPQEWEAWSFRERPSFGGDNCDMACARRAHSTRSSRRSLPRPSAPPAVPARGGRLGGAARPAAGGAELGRHP